MLTVYIAEKPDVGRTLAKHLGLVKSHQGYIECSNNCVVTWAIGHLLEVPYPDGFKDEWKPWRWEHLPLVPDAWITKPVARTKDQFNVVKSLLKKATTVVLATDAGREGELIGRSILEACKYKGALKRLWLSVYTDEVVKAALKSPLDGKEKDNLYQAALARRNSDWIYGMSCSRAASLAAGSAKFAIGRVQTPTLSLIVKRDLEIENFKAKYYYELEAQVHTAAGHTLTMYHSPKVEDRILDKAEAEKLKAKAEKASGPLKVATVPGKESAPLVYSLPGLQKDANRLFKWTAKKTLDVAQSLYEKKFTSYPRVDCEHLSSTQKKEVPETVSAIASTLAAQAAALKTLGINIRDSVFDDSKLTDHHGIIPTKVPLSGALSADEQKLYQLIAIRYLQMLAPDMQYEGTKIEMDANGVLFTATGRVILKEGWKSFKL